MRCLVPLLLAAASAAPAAAQDMAPPPDLRLTASATVANDYRFRGESLSGPRGAVSGTIGAEHLSGAFAEAFVGSTGRYAASSAEIDLRAGWTRSYGGWRPEAGAVGYLYPGGRGADFAEVYAALSRDLAVLTATMGANYAPSVFGRDNVYAFAGLTAAIPRTPFTLLARTGWEAGGRAPGGKLDWRLGASAARGPASVGLAWVGTDRAAAAGRRFGQGVVLTLRIAR